MFLRFVDKLAQIADYQSSFEIVENRQFVPGTLAFWDFFAPAAWHALIKTFRQIGAALPHLVMYRIGANDGAQPALFRLVQAE